MTPEETAKILVDNLTWDGIEFKKPVKIKPIYLARLAKAYLDLINKSSPKKDILCYTLVLKCADGLNEYQGYDTEEDAIFAGKNQMNEFVIDYEVKPLYWTQ